MIYVFLLKTEGGEFYPVTDVLFKPLSPMAAMQAASSKVILILKNINTSVICPVCFIFEWNPRGISFRHFLLPALNKECAFGVLTKHEAHTVY